MKKKLIALLLCMAMLLSVIPTAQAANLPFTDVKPNAWYYSAVEYAYENGLFNGTSATTFAPEMAMSRGMLVSVLYRYEGSPTVSGSNPFTDVDSRKYYATAVTWAAQNGVVNGTSATTFAPDTNIAREQMVAILYRYANIKGYNTSARNSLNAFTDRVSISAYAWESFQWAVAVGIISGTSATTLSPQGTATRAEVAAILVRFSQCYDDDPTNDPTPGIEVSQPATASSVDSIQVAGTSYKLGMTTSQLIKLAGQPTQQLSTNAGYVWWVYGANTYKDFFLAGIYQGQIVALCASGPGFSYLGHRMGETGVSVNSTSACNVQIFKDGNDSNRFHCVLLTSTGYHGSQTASNTTVLACESLVDFHLVNAFRVYHGRSVLTWHSAAATAARLHSEDMAANNYFSHYGLNGSTPSSRISAQGVTNYWGVGENIVCGYPVRSGVAAHNAWINSSGHRSNILDSSWTHMGVGGGYNGNSSYMYYYTEDFLRLG